VYAAADPNELARLGRIAGAAIGQVSLWGRLVEHSRGYRAAAAYPTRIRLVCVACLSEGRGEPAAVVDRDASADRTRLRPLCEAHAEGRTLPPARRVEHALLGAYQVDVVPDASIRRIRRIDTGRGHRALGAMAAAAAIVCVLAIGELSVARHRPSAVAAPTLTIPPPGVVASAGRQTAPIPRTGDDALRTITHAKLAALSPFVTVHCGTMTGTDVVPTYTCADRASNVFVENVGPADEHRFGTCDKDTVATTIRGDRILCWRLLPGQAGAG
jgi:hypothetical protein